MRTSGNLSTSLSRIIISFFVLFVCLIKTKVAEDAEGYDLGLRSFPRERETMMVHLNALLFNSYIIAIDAIL